MRFALGLLILFCLTLPADAQLFRRTCCRATPQPVTAQGAQSLQTQRLQEFIWEIYVLKKLDERFGDIENGLREIHDDTAYIRGYIEGQQATATIQPVQQPQVLMVPSSGISGIGSRRSIAQAKPLTPIPVKAKQLRPVTTLAPVQTTPR